MRYFLLFLDDLTIDIEGVDNRAFLEPLLSNVDDDPSDVDCTSYLNYYFFYGYCGPLPHAVRIEGPTYAAYDAALTLAGK